MGRESRVSTCSPLSLSTGHRPALRTPVRPERCRRERARPVKGSGAGDGRGSRHAAGDIGPTDASGSYRISPSSAALQNVLGHMGAVAMRFTRFVWSPNMWIVSFTVRS